MRQFLVRSLKGFAADMAQPFRDAHEAGVVVGEEIRAMRRGERGSINSNIGAVIGGVLTLVIGLVLGNVVINQATTSGANAKIGSFSGAQSINDLTPLVYFAAIVMVGVGLIGLGAYGAIKGND